ncbi:MAG: primosomal protein N', partial [Actinomycetota bacterium]|nr:primosomal protein N' [Actinomycetota bacterium]
MARRYARVVVEVAPAHLDRAFDYLIPEGAQVRVGQRVGVTFAGRRRTGWVVEVGDHSDADPDRIRSLDRIQGEHSWFDEGDLALWRWVADRYAAGLADVLRHALPARVAAAEREAREWSPVGPPQPADHPRGSSPGASAAGDSGFGPSPALAWRAYAASRLLEAAHEPRGEAFWWRPLPGDDPA